MLTRSAPAPPRTRTLAFSKLTTIPLSVTNFLPQRETSLSCSSRPVFFASTAGLTIFYLFALFRPAGDSFIVELAVNRAFTTLSYGGSRISVFPDGQEHSGLGVTPEGKNEEGCITLLNSASYFPFSSSRLTLIPSFSVHTQNETMAAGTAFAISYESDITKVTAENLVVFSVLYKYVGHIPLNTLRMDGLMRSW